MKTCILIFLACFGSLTSFQEVNQEPRVEPAPTTGEQAREKLKRIVESEIADIAKRIGSYPTDFESRMAEIKLEGVRRGGANTARCSQGRVEMVCEEVITPTETPAVFRIMIRVHDRSGSGPALARLDSLLSQVGQ